jgi:hypothetical protein
MANPNHIYMLINKCLLARQAGGCGLALNLGPEFLMPMKFFRLLSLSCFLASGHLMAGPAVLPTVPEARTRASLLHAAFEGVLRVMHRDFFRKGESKAIPSESLKDVFNAMAETQGVTIRWLASAETIMNVDNKASDAFEEQALKSIIGGTKAVDTVEQGRFRFVGAIAMQNACLKCHLSNRTSLEDRYAGLEISLPVQVEEVSSLKK